MASVKSISFTCPNCAKVLRASARPPAGKKIKCPACAHAFVPKLDQEENEATRIQEKPSIKARPRADDEDDDEKPRNGKSRALDDDDAPRKKNRRAEVDDDEEDDDDRPSKKKKARKKSRSMMLVLVGVFLVGGGGLLSCVLCGLGAFVWPGFLLSKNDELLAFVAPDANVLIGGKPKELKTKFAGFKDMFAQAAGPGPGNNFPEMEDFVINSEQFLVFGNTTNKKMVVVVKAENADIERLKKSNKLEAGKNVGGHALHKIKQGQFGNFGGGPEFVAISGRFVVVSDLPENELVATLNRGKKEPAKSAAIDLSRSVDKSPMWVAFTFDAKARDELRDLMDKGGQQIPSMKAAVPAVAGAKGATFTLDVTGANDIKFTASVMCKNADDATKIKTGLEEGWKLAKGLIDGVMMFGAMPAGPEAEAAKLMMRDLGTLAFQTKGDTATASMTFTNQTIQELAKAGKNMPMGGIGFNPPPPPPPPKKFGPPPFDGGPKVGKGKLIHNYTQPNVQPTESRDNIFQFQQGKRITITMISTTQGNADVDLHVFRGNVGENLLTGDISIGPNGNVSFIVPQTGFYRIRVSNLGPGVSTASVVNIYEQ